MRLSKVAAREVNPANRECIRSGKEEHGVYQLKGRCPGREDR